MTGGPDGPAWTGPLTPESGPAAQRDPARWQRWWTFNRDQYLQLGRFLSGLDTSSANAIGSRPTKEQVLRDIGPALERLLRGGGPNTTIRASLVSFARLEAEHGRIGLGLDHYAHHFLEFGMPENQEAAIVSLGVRGDPKSIDLVTSLLLDDEAGRKAAGGVPVGVRLRAFSAYALGLLGSDLENEEQRLRIVDALLVAMGADHSTTRETQVATAISVGLVPLEFCGDDPERLARHMGEGDLHLCGGVQLNYLLEVFANQELDPWLRAHAAPAMGRLATTAPNEYKEAVATRLFAALDAKSEDVEVKQGAALGLGLLADGDEDTVDEVVRKRLEKVTRKGDPLSQRFALIGLAQSAARSGEGENRGKSGEKARAHMLRLLSHGKDGVKPWAALALAVHGHVQGESTGAIAPDLARALRHQLNRTKDADMSAACVLALGVLRDVDSGDDVLAKFERSDDPLFRAYAALTLGLLSEREAKEALREALAGEERPDLGLELAIGLRLLGDAEVQGALLESLSDAEEPGARRATAGVLGLIGDRRAVEPLVALLDDESEEADVRTAAAMALGSICDGDRVAWNVAFAGDVHYEALTWTLSSPFGDATGIFDMR